MRNAYTVILMAAILSAAIAVSLCSDTTDAADESTIECYIYDSTGYDFSYLGDVSASVYYLSNPVKSTVLDGYTVLSKSTEIADATNVKKMVFSGIDASTPIDISKVYISFSMENYTVSTMQSLYFDSSNIKTVKDTGSERVYTLYGLSAQSIGTHIESGKKYTIGADSKLNAGLTFEFAKGTITGRVLSADGASLLGAELTVTDAGRNVTATAITDTSGNYSLTFFTGTYTVKVNSTGYYDEIRTIRFYDDKSYNASVNKQDDIKFTTVAKGSTIIGYISNTDDKGFDKVSNIEINLYYLKGTAYEVISSTSEIERVVENENTYYKFTLKEVPYKQIDKCYLYVNMTGYSVGIVQTSCLQSVPVTLIISGTPHVSYLFNTTMFPSGYIESGQTYSIGDKNMPGIQMKTAKGTISGKVITDTSSPTALNGVQVSIYDSKTNELVASGLTSNNGSYSIVCRTGYYKLTASINDYKTYTGYVTVYDDMYNPELNIQPDIKLSSSESLFGTDLPHVLMIVGLSVAGILILIVAVHRLMFFKKE